jgi:cytidine deaminase
MTEKLLAAAMKIQTKAYAPYSNFKVGAAILTIDGNIYVGANVENAAYPQGQCAEANAIGAMIAGGEYKIAEIMVYGDGEAECTPCGGCRQRIREFAGGGVNIHVAGNGKLRSTYSLDELLPHSFGPNHLK